MRVSAIFAQGGGGDYGHGCGSGCGDYYRYGGDYYYNGYNRRDRYYDYDYDDDSGLLSGLLG